MEDSSLSLALFAFFNGEQKSTFFILSNDGQLRRRPEQCDGMLEIRSPALYVFLKEKGNAGYCLDGKEMERDLGCRAWFGKGGSTGEPRERNRCPRTTG